MSVRLQNEKKTLDDLSKFQEEILFNSLLPLGNEPTN